MANSINNVGLTKLDNLDQEVKEKFLDLIKKINDKGYRVTIGSTYRDFDKQEKEYLKNPLATIPGDSLHNSALAIDFSITGGDPEVTLDKDSSKEAWEATGVPKLIKESGFRWGGDFNNNYDPIHADLKDKGFDKFDKNNLSDEQKKIRERWREIKKKGKNIDGFDALFIKIRQSIHNVKDNMLKPDFENLPKPNEKHFDKEFHPWEKSSPVQKPPLA